MREKPSLEVRDTLGTVVTEVATQGVPVRLLYHGKPDGAIVPLSEAHRLSLPLMASHAASQARKNWAAVRAAARDQGPQGLVVDSHHLAILINQDQARWLSEEVPELPPGTSLSWDPDRGLVTDTGHALAPGPYRVDGQIITFTVANEGNRT